MSNNTKIHYAVQFKAPGEDWKDLLLSRESSRLSKTGKRTRAYLSFVESRYVFSSEKEARGRLTEALGDQEVLGVPAFEVNLAWGKTRIVKRTTISEVVCE